MTMAPIAQLLALLLLSFQCLCHVIFTDHRRSYLDDFTVGIISTNPPPTTDAKPSSGSGGDSSGASRRTGILSGIGEASVAVQLVGGFLVGCVAGVVVYGAYRSTTKMIRTLQ